MPRGYKRKKEKVRVNEDKVKNAVAKVERGEKSIRKAAKEAGISEWTLRDRIKRGLPKKKEGGQQSMPEESETELAVMLRLKSKWGFASSRQEVIELVQDYVNHNKGKDTPVGKYLEKNCRFKVS